jgi:hypothetical protein
VVAVVAWLVILVLAVVVLEYWDKEPMVLPVLDPMVEEGDRAGLRVKQQPQLKEEMVEHMEAVVAQQ